MKAAPIPIRPYFLFGDQQKKYSIVSKKTKVTTFITSLPLVYDSVSFNWIRGSKHVGKQWKTVEFTYVIEAWLFRLVLYWALTHFQEFGRCVTSFQTASQPGFKPAFNELDVVGLVVFVAQQPNRNSFQTAVLSDGNLPSWFQYTFIFPEFNLSKIKHFHMKFLTWDLLLLGINYFGIKCWISFDDYALTNVIVTGSFLSFSNLQWRSLASKDLKIPFAFVHEGTLVSSRWYFSLPKSFWRWLNQLSFLQACSKTFRICFKRPQENSKWS